MYKVLKGFEGHRVGAEVIDTISRKPVKFGDYSKGDNIRHKISYKGNYYIVFLLPECYGELAGRCISLKDWEIK